MSIAAWKGFIQLFTKPFYWEKTEHGLVDVHDYCCERSAAVSRSRLEAAERGADRGATVGSASAGRSPGPWSGRDRRSGLDRRKGERRLGFGRRAGALTVPRRFPEGGPVAVPRAARGGRERRSSRVGLAAACMAIGLRLVGEDVVLPYSVGSLASAWSLWHAPAGSELAFGYDEPPLLPLLQVPLAFDTALTAELVLHARRQRAGGRGARRDRARGARRLPRAVRDAARRHGADRAQPGVAVLHDDRPADDRRHAGRGGGLLRARQLAAVRQPAVDPRLVGRAGARDARVVPGDDLGDRRA